MSDPVDYVLINGARLAYRIQGDISQTLFITLHGGRGFGSHTGDFEAFKGLSGQVRVLSFDFRGHGLSSATRPYTFRQIVDDIEGLRQHFAGDRKAVICGGSFGGFLAQQYALTYPDKVDHLVLRCTAPSYHHETGALHNLRTRAPAKAPMASEQMMKKVFSSFVDDNEFRLTIFAIWPLYSEAEHDQDKTLETIRRIVFNAESHNDLHSESEKYFDYRDRLPDLNVPTLILAGENDWITPLDQSQLLHRLIKRSKLVVFKGANHSLQRDRNADMLKAIKEFLAEDGSG